MNDDGHGNGANDFLIITDSTCDMPQEMVDTLGIVILPIRVIVEGKEYAHYPDGRELGFHEFYEKLRAGVGAKTAAANTEEFLALMEPALAAGKDVLYLGFSSALSSTYSIGAMTAAQLAEKYPERRIYAVDTLCASFGQGLLVYLAAQQRLQGKNIDEVRAMWNRSGRSFAIGLRWTICSILSAAAGYPQQRRHSARCSTSSPSCMWMMRAA